MPIAWTAVGFNPTVDQPYVGVDILNGKAMQCSIGSDPDFRFPGVIQVTIFVPDEHGTQLLRQLADTVCDIWRNAQFSYNQSGTIRCRTPYLSPPKIADGYLTQFVSVDFWRDAQAGAAPSTTASQPVYPNKLQKQIVTGAINGVNVVFTIPAAPNPVGAVQVFLNGELLDSPVSYGLAGAVFTFVNPPQAGDDVEIYA